MPLILIADDHPLFREALRGAITRLMPQAQLREAQDASGLYAMVDAAPDADLLLLDLNMPDPGGVAVLETLAAQGAGVRVCVVTADIQETTRARCLELGARAFLNKPVDHDALRGVLAALLADA